MTRYSDDARVDTADFFRHALIHRRDALKAAIAGGALAAGAGLLRREGVETEPPARAAAADTSLAGTPRAETVIVDQGSFTVFDRFNLFIPNGSDPSCGLTTVAMEYLWYLNSATGKLMPWLATGYHYNSDYTQFTMQLDPRAHWSDGQPFTSADVKFSIELLKGDVRLLGGGPVDLEAERITTPDDHTVVIDLNRRDTRYHYGFICAVSSGFYVVPEHIWNGQDPTTFTFNPPVLTGPYKLKTADRNASLYVWERDTDYWAGGRMSFEPRYVVYRTAPTIDSEIQQFKAAATDQGGGAGSARFQLYPLVQQLVDQGDRKASLTTMYDPCPHVFVINCDESKGLLADHRMRQALSLLVDREKMNNLFTPAGVPAVYPWAPYPQNRRWEKPHIADRYPHTFDPHRAAKLLDEIGVTRGRGGQRTHHGKPVGFEIMSPSAAPDPNFLTCQIFASSLKSAGIGASVSAPVGPEYSERTALGRYDIRMTWLCAETNDPFQLFKNYTSDYAVPIGQTAVFNDGRFRDATFDRLVGELQSATPGSQESMRSYEKVLAEWLKQQPVLAIHQINDPFEVNTTWWTGWPTQKDLYITPNDWWGQFIFILARLKAVHRA